VRSSRSLIHSKYSIIRSKSKLSIPFRIMRNIVLTNSGIAVGANKGHKVTPKAVAPQKRVAISQRTDFVRKLVREVTGLSPYERRIIELIRNSGEKRARKFAKKRLGTHTRAKAKLEEMQNVIQEAKRH